MVSFDHRDMGTSASEWSLIKDSLRTADLPDPATHALAVLSAHPDDETLGAGALISSFVVLGGRVEVGLATAGEGANPQADGEHRRALASRRLEEFSAAAKALADGQQSISTSFFDLPDSKLDRDDQLLSDKLEAWFATTSAKFDGLEVVLVAPYANDGHSDHEALGRAAKNLANRHEVLLWEYPVWFWHWSSPTDTIETLQTWWRFEGSPEATQRKKVAIAEHATQLEDLGDGQGPILRPEFLEHFGGTETFNISPPGPQVEHTSYDAERVFDEVHRRDEDPWSCGSSWYEQRKRSLTLSLLAQPKYLHGLELGCSVGYNTAELASRCETLTATDASTTALSYASARVNHLTNVELIAGTIPHEWPASRSAVPYDLIVISEVGYYLSGEDLVEVDQWIRENSNPQCELLLCHWRHPIEGWESSAESVHRFFLRNEQWQLVSSLVEKDTLQHSFVRQVQ